MNDALKGGSLYSMPLYKVVAERLTERLAQGEWKPGESIPSESQLAKNFQVSIGTIRKAIDELVANKVLVRQAGRGTYVTMHTENRYLGDFFQIIRDDGHKEFPETRILSFERVKADPATANRLGIPTGTVVYRYVNVLYLGNTPIVLDEITVPKKLFNGLTGDMIQNRETPIYGVYQAKFNVTVIRTEESLKAVLAEKRIADVLELGEGAPVLQLQRVAYAYHDQPVEARTSYVNTEHYHYLAGLGR